MSFDHDLNASGDWIYSALVHPKIGFTADAKKPLKKL